MSTRLRLVAIFALLAATACSSTKKSSASPAPAAANASGTTAGTDGSIASPSSSATVGDMTADNYPDGFYTGYDGGADAFALLVPGFRTYTIADTTVAKLETVNVTVAQSTLTSLIAALQKINPSMTTANITKMFSQQQTMYRITPLKAGSTTITTSFSPPPASSSASGTTGMGGMGGMGSGSGGGAGGPPGSGPTGSDPWSKGDSLTLLVANYTSAQMALGKARYATAHDADDPACASCHLTGKDGAPPHALGDINDIPDVAAEQWVTTGKLGSRTATIPHAWKFASTDEELGTVAYVRSLETNDPEQLVALQFAQRFGLTLNADGSFSAASTTTTGN